MDGDFDFPPANDPAAEVGSLTARFNSLRQTFQADRDDLHASWTAAADDRQSRLGWSSRSAAARVRGRISNSFRLSQGFPNASSESENTIQTSLAPLSDHPRPGRRLFNSRRPPMEPRDLLLVTDGQQQAEDTTTELEQELRIRAGRASLRNRLNKRRKIDRDSKSNDPPGFHNFEYGHYGQVEEGALKMEIVSCDGGEFSRDPPRLTGERYQPENVLTDDERVYCTKTSSCNLLLRHIGETNFSLARIVVRAPKDGYTAPIQQGLVFVGNNAQELLDGTTGYYIRYGRAGAPNPRSVDRRRDRQQLTLLESLHDEEIWEQSLIRRSISASSAGGANDASRELATYFNALDPEGRVEIQQSTVDEVARAPTPPSYSSDESSADDVDDQGRDQTQDVFQQFDNPTEMNADGIEQLLNELRDDVRSENDRRSHPRRRATPGRFMEVRVAPQRGERIKPLRTFFIKPSRDLVTLTFDPPVSTRFILLKLFSPMTADGGNIDIQYVGVQGYAGSRFFPATQLK